MPSVADKFGYYVIFPSAIAVMVAGMSHLKQLLNTMVVETRWVLYRWSDML